MSWLEEFLAQLLKEIKLKWGSVELKLVKIRKNKVEIRMIVRDEKVKLLIYGNGRIWVASRLTGLNIALKRISQRILEKVRGSESEG